MKSGQQGVILPWLACSLFGILVSSILMMSDFYKMWDFAFQKKIEELASQPLVSVSPAIVFLAISFVCIACVGAMLNSPKQWRKIILWVNALILTFTSVFVLAVWGFYFSSITVTIGLLWAGTCALFYASRNPLPCEGEIDEKTQLYGTH